MAEDLLSRLTALTRKSSRPEKDWTEDDYEEALVLMHDVREIESTATPPILREVGVLQEQCTQYEKELARKNALSAVQEAQDLEEKKKALEEECSAALSTLKAMSQIQFSGAVQLRDLNGPIVDTTPTLSKLVAKYTDMTKQIEIQARNCKTIEEFDAVFKKVKQITSHFEETQGAIDAEMRQRQAQDDEAVKQSRENKISQLRAKEQDRRQQEQAAQEAEMATKTRAHEEILKNASDQAEEIQKMLSERIKELIAEERKASVAIPVQSKPRQNLSPGKQQEEDWARSIFGDTSSQSSIPKAEDSRYAASTSNSEAVRSRASSGETGGSSPVQDERTRKQKILRKKRQQQIEISRQQAEARDEFVKEKDLVVLQAQARAAIIEYKADVWEAAKTGNQEMMKWFCVAYGCSRLLEMHNPDPDEGGRTVLHTACWLGHHDLVKFLLEIGGKVNEIDTAYNQATPLIEAARAGRRDICLLLINHLANIKAQDYHGDTCCHWAVRKGRPALAIAMIKAAEKARAGQAYGILDIKNCRGKSFLDLIPSEPTKKAILADVLSLGAAKFDIEISSKEGAEGSATVLMKVGA